MLLTRFLALKRQEKLVKFIRNKSWKPPDYPEYNLSYIFDKNNLEKIEENIVQRKGIGNIRLIHELKSSLNSISPIHPQYEVLKRQLYEELANLPNTTHEDVKKLGESPSIIKKVNEKPSSSQHYYEFHEITKRLNLVRTEHLGNVTGTRSYFLLGEMAELESALTNYFVEKLLEDNYKLISVPDVLPRSIIEACGMKTKGDRNQVYSLLQEDLCLSGTSEMALAGFLSNSTFEEEELPVKLAAISRCYRAETSSTTEERGIFRVHEFTKVEMFLVTKPEDSNLMLETIRITQERNFGSLKLHFQVLDMPGHELGAPAHRKYDIEAWMPGRKIYGEISSCSNCTDYQARKLGIRYRRKDGIVDFVHTLNGTACAVPRLLIALTETGQNAQNKEISIPEVLQPFMRHKKVIRRQKSIPELKLLKNK